MVVILDKLNAVQSRSRLEQANNGRLSWKASRNSRKTLHSPQHFHHRKLPEMVTQLENLAPWGRKVRHIISSISMIQIMSHSYERRFLNQSICKFFRLQT